MSYTTPEPITIHPVIDQDLDRLLNESESSAHSWALALFFTGVGMLPNLLTTISTYLDKKPVGVFDIVLCCLCVGLLFAGVAKYTEAMKDNRNRNELRERLRGRRRISVVPNRVG